MPTSLYPKLQIYFGEHAINIEKNPQKVLQNDAKLKQAYELLHSQALVLIQGIEEVRKENQQLRGDNKKLIDDLAKEKLDRATERATATKEITHRDGLITNWQTLYQGNQKFMKEYIDLIGENLSGVANSKVNKIKFLQDLLVKTRRPNGSYETYWSLKDLVEEVRVLRQGQKGIFDKLGIIAVDDIDDALTYPSDNIIDDTKGVYKLADLVKSRNDFRNFIKNIGTKLHKDDLTTILAEIDLMLAIKGQFDTLKIAINTIIAQLGIMDKLFKTKEVKITKTKKGVLGGLSRKSIKPDIQAQFVLMEGVIKVGLGRDWDDETIGTNA